MKKKLPMISVFVILGVWMLLYFCFPLQGMYLCLVCGMLFCTYLLAQNVLMKAGWKKIGAVKWWITTCGLYIFYDYSLNEQISGAESIVFVLCLVILFVESMRYFFQTNDLSNELAILFLWGSFSFFLAILLVNINTYLFFVFRFIVIALLICGLKIALRISRLLGILCIIVMYVLMVVLNGTLSTQLLQADMAVFEDLFYENVRNMYSLPELEEVTESSLELLINFGICRILDAILLGVLVDILSQNGNKEWLPTWGHVKAEKDLQEVRNSH